MLDMQVLKDSLKPWVQVDTWHKNHPLDEKRFFRALKGAFDRLGTTAIHDSYFEEVIGDLVEELHPHLSEDFKEEKICKFTIKASNIANYLSEV